MDFLIFLTAVGLGIGTAALAKRYNRPPLAWGIFGGLLFIIALPVLLLKGPNEARRGVVVHQRNSGSGPHLPDNPVATPEMSLVLDVLAEAGHADFDSLAQRTGLDEDTLADAIDELLDISQLETTHTGFLLSSGVRKARQTRPAAPDPTRRVAPPSGESDHAERLRRLASLHADGLLSDDEFEAKRSSTVNDL